MQSERIHSAIIMITVAAYLLSGCTKSWTQTERYAATNLRSGAALLFLLDSESQEKSSRLENKIIRSMSHALEESNVNVRILGSKDFCPEMVEPFYSPEDILALLQDAQFRQKVDAEQIQYILIIYVRGSRGDWVTRTHTDTGGFAVYNKRETEHYTKAIVIDAEGAETAGVLLEQCSASQGYGFGVGVGNGFCCAFPFAWYGGPTEDLAIRNLATSVAKFLTDKDATPNAKRPDGEQKEAPLPPEPTPKPPEE